MKSKMMNNLKEVFSVNKKLVICVAIAAAGLLALQGYIHTSQMECLGVADSKATNVSFETAVVVKRIFVLPGQTVAKGQPLLEVETAELNLRMLELRTELEALESEMNVRDSLMDGFVSSKGKKKLDKSPLGQQIAGFRRQVEEVKRLQMQSVRFAEEDGIVATVDFRANEQVPPFTPIITLSSRVPNLVYGFIHEDRMADFKMGDKVEVESLSGGVRTISGKVVSLGSRITAFPERLQSAFGLLYWGRELVVALPEGNAFFMGEKLRIHSAGGSPLRELSSQAFAATEIGSSEDPFLAGLQLEAGGLLLSTDGKTLLVVSDDEGPSGSPFWRIGVDGTVQENLIMDVGEKIEDLESLTKGDGYYFAAASMSEDKDDISAKKLEKRSMVVRFNLDGGKIIVDRKLNLRNAMMEFLINSAVLQEVHSKLDKLEVESLMVDGHDAYIGLKEPQLRDGSSLVLTVKNFTDQMESGEFTASSFSIFSLLRLQDPGCDKPSRVTDIQKSDNGILLSSVCSKKEGRSQVWWLPHGSSASQVILLKSLSDSRIEGIVRGMDKGELYLSSDNGKGSGSDFYKIQVNEEL